MNEHYASSLEIRKMQEDDGWIYDSDVPKMVTLYPGDRMHKKEERQCTRKV